MKQIRGNFGLIIITILGLASIIIFINSSFLLQEEIAAADEFLSDAQSTKLLLYKLQRRNELSDVITNLQ